MIIYYLRPFLTSSVSFFTWCVAKSSVWKRVTCSPSGKVCFLFLPFLWGRSSDHWSFVVIITLKDTLNLNRLSQKVIFVDHCSTYPDLLSPWRYQCSPFLSTLEDSEFQQIVAGIAWGTLMFSNLLGLWHSITSLRLATRGQSFGLNTAVYIK